MQRQIKRTRYEAFRGTLSSGQTAGAVELGKTSLDSNFPRLTGVAVVTVGKQASLSYDVAISSGAVQIADAVPSELLEISGNTPMNDRFLDLDEPNPSQDVSVFVALSEDLTQDLTVKIIFRLEEC